MTFIAILLYGLTIGPQVGASAHDARWWLSLEPEQRTEFVAGYASYYTWKLRGAGKFSGSADTYRVTLEARLTAKPADLAQAIADLLDEEAKRTSSGAGWRGNFGGHYWAELGEHGRLGFLQGAFECQRRDAKATAKFSRPESWYATEISQGYGMTSADPMGSDEALLGTGILDVLLRLEDSARSREQPVVKVGLRQAMASGARKMTPGIIFLRICTCQENDPRSHFPPRPARSAPAGLR